jgi:hypothetical protein
VAADLPRLIAALYVWNARQTRFVASGRRGACPCQSRCDSGRAEAPGCEAVIGLRQPQAFRMVCPALTRDAAGEWRCSVPAAAVRPHLGRFFGYHAVAVVVGLVAFAAAWQFILRSAGYTIPWHYVAWPGNWSEVHRLQADQLVGRAKDFLRRGDLKAAQLALATARQLNPEAHEASLLIAELKRLEAPATSDAIFRDVITRAPDLASAAARRWCTLLVARGDFVAVRALAAERLRREPISTAPFWTEALLFADQRAIPDETVAALAADTTLNTTVRDALHVVAGARLSRSNEQQQRLEQIADRALLGTGEVAALALVSRHLGLSNLTTRILRSAPAEFAPALRLQLELELIASPAEHARALAQLLQLAPETGALTLVANELLRRPDAALLEQLLRRLESADAARSGKVDVPLRLATFSAVAASGDAAQRDRAVALVAAAAGGNFPGAKVLTNALSSRTAPTPGSWAPLLDPVPLSTLYAIHERGGRTSALSFQPTSR